MRTRPSRDTAIFLIIVTISAVALAVVNNASFQPGPSQSDRFWTNGSFAAIDAEVYEDVATMRDESDLVVVGTIVSVAEGRSEMIDATAGEMGIARYIDVEIAVEQVVKSHRPVEKTVTFEIFLRSAAAARAAVADASLDRGVFFLRNKGVEAERLGLEPAAIDAHKALYRLVNQSQGVLREIDGKVAVHPGVTVSFLSDLAGTSFESLVTNLVG